MMNLISTSHLMARAGVRKAPCLAARVALLLLSAENSATIINWIIGAAAAWLPIRERIQHCRAILLRPAVLEPQGLDSRVLPAPRNDNDGQNKKRGGIAPAAPPFLNSLVQG
jgi:hypothetical protein